MPNKDTGTLIAVAVLVGALALLVMSRKVLAKDPATREASPAADAVVSMKIPSLGLTVKASGEMEIEADRTRCGFHREIDGSRFALDDVQTTLGCLRKDAPLPAGTDAATYARHAVAEQVKTAKGNGVRILEERDLTIAGVPGRLVEMLVNQGRLISRSWPLSSYTMVANTRSALSVRRISTATPGPPCSNGWSRSRLRSDARARPVC
jgi:hypothetical protein